MKRPNEAWKGSKEAVYLTVALTALSPSNGWWIILKGSHRRTADDISPAWERVRMIFEAGDALIWDGNTVALPSEHGQGKFVTFIYRRQAVNS
jgi:ectoine hydroxylase-related dioxygenase (phytanoyl-CoA dioxygenase family)